MRIERYVSYDKEEGAQFEKGKLDLEQLRNLAIQNGEPKLKSGKQELMENIINRFI